VYSNGDNTLNGNITATSNGDIGYGPSNQIEQLGISSSSGTFNLNGNLTTTAANTSGAYYTQFYFDSYGRTNVNGVISDGTASYASVSVQDSSGPSSAVALNTANTYSGGTLVSNGGRLLANATGGSSTGTGSVRFTMGRSAAPASSLLRPAGT